MEKQFRLMQKMLGGLLALSFLFWSGAIYGIFSFITLIGIVLFIAIAIKNRKVDERGWQTYLLACYGATMIAISFSFILEGVAYLKTSSVNHVSGAIMAVLVVSQGILSVVLGKLWNKNL